jgi:hypothetical protein
LLINGAFVSSQIFLPGEAAPLLRNTAHALIEANRMRNGFPVAARRSHCT